MIEAIQYNYKTFERFKSCLSVLIETFVYTVISDKVKAVPGHQKVSNQTLVHRKEIIVITNNIVKIKNILKKKLRIAAREVLIFLLKAQDLMIFIKLKCINSSQAKTKWIFELKNNTTDVILKKNHNLKV